MMNVAEDGDLFETQVANRIATLTLDRMPVNALNLAAYVKLAENLTSLAANADVNVLIIRSASHVFSAGADLKEVAVSSHEFDVQKQFAARNLFEIVRNFPVPVIAAINGPALGAGAGLAACADIRYALEGATIGLPEINVGRAGGSRHMMRLLPQGQIRKMFFTGEPITAVVAHQNGLVDEVVIGDSEDLDKAVMELAATIASKDGTALRLAKESINLCENLPVEAGYQVEQQYSLRLGLLRQLDSR